MSLYQRKTPEDLDCGITVFMKMLGGKWKPCILDLVAQGYHRPSEIHRQLGSATPRVIDMQLSELEAFGLLSKQVTGSFPLRTDYTLTEKGRGVLPIIAQMDQWGKDHAEDIKAVATHRQSSGRRRSHSYTE